MKGEPRLANTEKRKKSAPLSVDDLNMEKVRKSIQWRGDVWLDQLREDDESLLGEYEWPVKSGKIYYACATSGLLFDKKTGRCLQSVNVWLKLETLIPATQKELAKYISSRKQRDYGHNARDIICEV